MKSKIIRFLLLTFLFLALGWGSCLVCGFFGITVTNAPYLYPLYIFGGFSPTVAAFLVCRKGGFKAWIGSVFDFKHKLTAYLLVLVFAAAFFLTLCLSCGFTPGAPIFIVPLMIPMMLFGGGLEEAGWRGILQPELEKKLGFTLSALIVAVIWWVWHLPLFFIPGVGQYGADFFVFGINVLGLTFALGAVKKCTGSTWLCVLMHCLINSLHSVFIIHDSYIGSAAASVALIALTLVLVQIQKKKNIFR